MTEKAKPAAQPPKPKTFHQAINSFKVEVGDHFTAEEIGRFGKNSKGKPVGATVIEVTDGGADVVLQKDS